MCGIFAICGQSPETNLEIAKKLCAKQKHRGPDFSGFYESEKYGHILCHERLAIIDLHCIQPIQGSTEHQQVIHNGEIYNHEKLKQTELADKQMRTVCDSEVIIHMWEKYGTDFCNKLDGIFGFVLLDREKLMAARDPIGVKSMYYGKDKHGVWYFASEMKSLIDTCGENQLAAFPPGHYFTPETGFVRYYQPVWLDHTLANGDCDLVRLREALIEATKKRLMSDVPIGLLLSGGLDSSLTSAIAMREMRKKGKKLLSFSIGLDENAPDLIAARKVAKFVGTEHHEVHFTVDEGIAALNQLIYHLETYDVTSVRASTPMYLMSRLIRAKGVKVVLSGEGADEIFGGYLYFHNAPDNGAFQEETVRRVCLLSTADCLRADKSCMAHGIEIRVPFLDRSFLDIAMQMSPEHKRAKEIDEIAELAMDDSKNYNNNNNNNNNAKNTKRLVEKWVIRKAFDSTENPYLPPEILWRQKEQFSDGVGYNWIDQMMAFCAGKVSDKQMSEAAVRFPHNTPETKEAYYIREIFTEHYPGEAAAKTVLKWIPKWQLNRDPSGRASQMHIGQHSWKDTDTNGIGKAKDTDSKSFGQSEDTNGIVANGNDDDDDSVLEGENAGEKTAEKCEMAKETVVFA